MKKIEFRGYSKELKEWFYGDLISLVGNRYGIISHEIIPLDFDELLTSKISDIVETRSVSQYTGLKDKNKKKIFEGDIVKQKTKYCYTNLYEETICTDETLIGDVVIIASKGVCMKNPNIHDHNTGENYKFKGYVNVRGYRSEIMGNCLENPQLLLEKYIWKY